MRLVSNWLRSSLRNEAAYRRYWRRLRAIMLHAEQEYDASLTEASSELATARAAIESPHRVLSGPFKGMTYEELEAAGSALHPKLAGCYEQELHPYIEEAISRSPTRVIDVGSAEGYYAVGLAMRLPESTVSAYDTDQRAASLCQQMAAANGVSARVTVEGHCGEEELIALQGSRCLVWSDCESYESTLFSDPVVRALAESDVMIETHDFIEPFTTRRLVERFKASHKTTVIHTVPDQARPFAYQPECLAGFDVASRTELMAEQRPAPMHWLWCKSRRHG